MKTMLASIAAAGFVAVVAMPAQAGQSGLPNAVQNTAQSENTDISAQRRYHRHRYYAPRYRYAPRYGYYRPYRSYGYAQPYGYYRPYYNPGVSFGFWGGPRLGVWF